jgi:hypothetical protein
MLWPAIGALAVACTMDRLAAASGPEGRAGTSFTR